MASVNFRWSIWSVNPELIRLLNHSIGTFKTFWGNRAQYLVCTPEASTVSAGLLVDADIIEIESVRNLQFSNEDKSNWGKWDPRMKLNPASVEFFVDLDVFILNEPTEIEVFINSKMSFLCLLENFKELWPYGAFGSRLPTNFLPINAGFFGQNAGVDLASEFRQALSWWHHAIRGTDKEMYHDEQGALLFSLHNFAKINQIMTLPIETYRNASPFDPPIKDVNKLKMVHATCKEHFAFYEYFDVIRSVSGIE